MTRPAGLRSLPPDRIVRREFVRTADIRFDSPHDPDPSYPWDALEASMVAGWNPASTAPPLREDGNSRADGYDPFVLFARWDGKLAPLQGWHRVEMAKKLCWRHVEAFVVRPWMPHNIDVVRECIAKYAALPSQPQTLSLPWRACACAGRGDRTKAIWEDTGWPWWWWCGRRVLDVGCCVGAHAIEAARHGAEVVGIDKDAAAVRIGDDLIDAAGIATAKLLPLDFWSGPAKKPIPVDIVTAHQCLYWLSQPPHPAGETLDALCGLAKRAVVAYTHILPGPSEEPGWRPTEAECVEAFAARGFAAEVRPFDADLGWPTKRTVVARRMP